MSRYIVKKGSESGHCCFSSSVIDTEAGAHVYIVCETVRDEDAFRIAGLLNAEAVKAE